MTIKIFCIQTLLQMTPLYFRKVDVWNKLTMQHSENSSNKFKKKWVL
jgi:hypothetical protein